MTIYRDDLERVYALIERPEAWCQCADAMDACGREVTASHPHAVAWCLVGAAMRCNVDLYDEDFVTPNYMLPREWNDRPSRQHAEVLALLRAAIERAPVRDVIPASSERKGG